jgi:phosphate transport system protein
MSTQAGLLEQLVQRDIDAIRGRIKKMGGLVVNALEDALAALSERDRARAFGVVLRDHEIDALEDHIDRLCQEFLVRHIPVATQLRFVLSVIKINAELERMGDYAESIARRAVDLAVLPPQPVYPRLVEMANIALRMLRQSVDAFMREDVEAARAVLDLDREVNAVERRIHAEIEQSASAPGAQSYTLLNVSDRIERVADRACNICEDVIYLCTGEIVRHLPRYDRRILFLSLHNGYRTQVAEAVGHSLAPTYLEFYSAGLEPMPLDAPAIAAGERHGLPLSRQRAKSIADIGRIEDFHVVITFGREAEDICAKLPYKIIYLDWDVSRPEEKATDEYYDRTYEDVRAKVTDLVEALSSAIEREEDDK